MLATEVADAGMPVERWDEVVRCGAVRLCPVCDGWDVIDKRIGVVTSETNPVGHALLMRTFSADVLLFERSPESALTDEDRQKLSAAGVRYIDSPLAGVTMSEDMKPILHTRDGEDYPCDVFYPMLGENVRSDLARALGAETRRMRQSAGGRLLPHLGAGLFAVGNVTCGLNQIAVVTGQAALAATTIHNMLPWALRPARPSIFAPGG